MKPITRCLPLAILLITSAACSDPKEASQANFTEALRTGLAEEKLCLRQGFSSVEVPKNGYNGTYGESLDVLAQAGILHAKEEIREGRRVSELDRMIYARRRQAVPTKDTLIVYSLTEEGERTSRTGQTLDRREIRVPCYGTPKLEKVVRWTEPAEAMGRMVTEVTYTYTITEMPAWVNHPAMRKAFPELETILPTLDSVAEGSTYLVLTNEGWRLPDKTQM